MLYENHILHVCHASRNVIENTLQSHLALVSTRNVVYPIMLRPKNTERLIKSLDRIISVIWIEGIRLPGGAIQQYLKVVPKDAVSARLNLVFAIVPIIWPRRLICERVTGGEIAECIMSLRRRHSIRDRRGEILNTPFEHELGGRKCIWIVASGLGGIGINHKNICKRSRDVFESDRVTEIRYFTTRSRVVKILLFADCTDIEHSVAIVEDVLMFCEIPLGYCHFR